MPLESRESSSPIITRAVADGLLDRTFNALNFPVWQKAGLTVLSVFPPAVARRAAQWDMARSALDPARAEELTVEQLVAERLADYRSLAGQFDAIVLGAALGGAAAHLALAVNALFLPQPFILSFHGGSPGDEVGPHYDRSRSIAGQILENNKDVLAIGHFDPIHDGWLTRKVNHLRLKLVDLPQGYREFLQRKLRPGGSILYLDCGATWLQYELGPRSVYQIGGWGGIPAEEFLEGSARIDDILARWGSPHRGGWRVEGLEPRERPESEWGSEPGLGSALETFAAENGFRFFRIRLPHPHDFSRLTYQTYIELCRANEIEPQGVVIETFTQYDPTTVLRGGLLPLWLIFNTDDSRAFLSRCRPSFPPSKPVFFSGLVTLSRTPDMVPWNGWAESLDGLDWVNIGARPNRYPEDMLALWNWPTRLRDWVAVHPAPLKVRLKAQDIVEVAKRL
jgi:hypothetical protein